MARRPVTARLCFPRDRSSLLFAPLAVTGALRPDRRCTAQRRCRLAELAAWLRGDAALFLPVLRLFAQGALAQRFFALPLLQVIPTCQIALLSPLFALQLLLLPPGLLLVAEPRLLWCVCSVALSLLAQRPLAERLLALPDLCVLLARQFTLPALLLALQLPLFPLRPFDRVAVRWRA